MERDLDRIAFEKDGGLVPAVVQDARSGRVLMLGYMNRAALAQTIAERRVTFFSRSKERLWTKGESSGHFLEVADILVDCDGDTLLIKAVPNGPTCHTGADTCWSESNAADPLGFFGTLESIITDRLTASAGTSYTRSLLDGGAPKVGQKVGEEAVETVIAALSESDDRFVDEASDLVFHLMVLLRTRDKTLADVAARLEERHGA